MNNLWLGQCPSAALLSPNWLPLHLMCEAMEPLQTIIQGKTTKKFSRRNSGKAQTSPPNSRCLYQDKNNYQGKNHSQLSTAITTSCFNEVLSNEPSLGTNAAILNRVETYLLSIICAWYYFKTTHKNISKVILKKKK